MLVESVHAITTVICKRKEIGTICDLNLCLSMAALTPKLINNLLLSGGVGQCTFLFIIIEKFCALRHEVV